MHKSHGLVLVLLAIAAQAWARDVVIRIPKEVEKLSAPELIGDSAEAAKRSWRLRSEGKIPEGFRELEEAVTRASGIQAGKLQMILAYAKLNQGDKIGAEREFGKIARGEIQASPADYLDSRIRIAYLKLARNDREEALRDFLNIAEGTMETDALRATDASLRAAALLRLLRRSQESISVYEQIAVKAPKIEDQLYAKLQIAGLYWESGKNDYGTAATVTEQSDFFEKSKAICREIMAHPAVAPETEAIAELIYLEDFYFLGDYVTCHDLCQQYLDKWLPFYHKRIQANIQSEDSWDPARQIVTAQTWLLFCKYRIGRFSEAIETARLIRSGVWKASDPYKNFNVFGYAIMYEAFSEEALGNSAKGQTLRELGITSYPGWFERVSAAEESKLKSLGRN